jgi:hypothetical protein
VKRERGKMKKASEKESDAFQCQTICDYSSLII